MDKRAPRPFQIEWFNVTYRSVAALIVLLVIVVAGGLGARFYWGVYAPRSGAEAEILRAERRLDDCSSLSGDDRLRELLQGARLALAEAREAYGRRLYDEAQVAALRSANLSDRALDLFRVEEAEDQRVRFYRIEGDVRVKKAGEFSWEPANQHMGLRIGDQIKTSSSGSAQLIYFDGTVTTVQTGSLLEIRELYENPVTKVRRVREKLNWGELRASTQRKNVEGSFHEVATEKAAARAEEAGEFRVSFDRNQQTAEFDVFEGRVEIASSNRRDSLAAGERVRSRADGSLSAKEALPQVPRLLAPRDQRVFIFEDPAMEAITLSWERLTGIDRYRLTISDKMLFTGTLYDADRQETTAVLDGVGPGSYYWKVAAVAPNGTRGPFSTPRRFRVSSQKIRDRADTTPPALEITDFVPVGLMVIVNGHTEPGATLWVENEKIEVDANGSFYAVVRLKREGLNELQFVAQDTAGNETQLTREAFLEVF